MIGNKLKTQLIAGILLWGLCMSFPIGYARAQVAGDIQADVTVVDQNGDIIRQKITQSDGGKIDIQKRTVSAEEKAAAAQQEKSSRSETRKNLREAERQNSLGSRVWGAMTNWARSDAGLQRRAGEMAEKLNKKGKSDASARAAIAASTKAQESRYLRKNDEVTQMTYTGADGKSRTVLLNDDMEAVAGTMKDCMPIMLKLSEARSCIFCPLFVVLANTAQTMSVASYDALAGAIKILLLLGFALYVGFVTMKQVSAFTKQDGPKYLTEVLTLSFKVLVAYLILINVGELYRLVLTPLLKAGIEFGGAFLFHNPNGLDVQSCVTANTLVSGSIVQGYFDASLFAQVDCFIRAVLQELAVSQAVGSSLMCVSVNSAGGMILPDFSMLASGLCVWLFAWLVCLAFAFYLIDSIVRLGIIGGLMPFLIAAWPFKITSKYTVKGWNMFMNTFFTFVFLGLVVSVNVELAGQALSGGKGPAGMEMVMGYMNNDDIASLKELLAIGLVGFVFLVLCSVFGFKLCAEAITLAQGMAEAKEGGIGAKMGSDVYGAAKKGAQWTAKGTGAVLGAGASYVGQATGATAWANKKIDAVHAKFDAVGSKIGQKLGFIPKDLPGGGGDGGSGGSSGAATAANSGGFAPNTAGENPETAGNTENQEAAAKQAQNAAGRQQAAIDAATNAKPRGEGDSGSGEVARGNEFEGERRENENETYAEPAAAEETAAESPETAATIEEAKSNAERHRAEHEARSAETEARTTEAINQAQAGIAQATQANTGAAANNNHGGDRDKGNKQRIADLEGQIRRLKQALSQLQVENNSYQNERDTLNRQITTLEAQLQQAKQESTLANQEEAEKINKK